MLTLCGLATVVLVVAALLSGRVSPVVGLTIPPLLGALVAGFTAPEIGEFFSEGLIKVAPVAAMFVFAILFFGILSDAGLFAPLVNGLVRLVRGNVVALAVGTALAGMLAHLDGAGATTFLLTIPALLPVYQRLGMNPYLMLLLLAMGAGIFNMLPWAGPLGRAATVIDADPALLWRPLIPVQAAGAVLLLVMAAWLGWREQQRIAAAGGGAVAGDPAMSQGPGDEDAPVVPRTAFWLNACLGIAVVIALVSGIFPAPLVFIIGLSLALVLNHGDAKDQMKAIGAHAPNAIAMAAIILSAGVFLGIMDKSGMLKAIAGDIASILPASLGPYLHLVLAFLGTPMELLLNTDAYYFGLLPVAVELSAGYGVEPAGVVYALVVGNIVGTFISPFSAALWLALGLSNLSMGRHIRFSLLPIWGYSLVLLGVAWLFGLF